MTNHRLDHFYNSFLVDNKTRMNSTRSKNFHSKQFAEKESHIQRLGLTNKQMYLLKSSWKAISAEMQANGITIFVEWVSHSIQSLPRDFSEFSKMKNFTIYQSRIYSDRSPKCSRYFRAITIFFTFMVAFKKCLLNKIQNVPKNPVIKFKQRN